MWNDGFEDAKIDGYDYQNDSKTDLFKESFSLFDSSPVQYSNIDDLFDDKDTGENEAKYVGGKTFWGDLQNYKNGVFFPKDGSVGIALNASSIFKEKFIWRRTDEKPQDEGNREGLDVWSVLIHEFGHLAGLPHYDLSEVDFEYGESVMNPNLNCDIPYDTLRAYDCEAVRLNYGRHSSPGMDSQIKKTANLSQVGSKK